MARAKYQVLVIPYYLENNIAKYCIFYRSDLKIWQFISGGGEDEDSSILVSAKREAYEEANIDIDFKYVSLDTLNSIPTYCFKDAIKNWGTECLVIPEYVFGVRLDNISITLSNEHLKYKWVDYEIAQKRLNFDSNKTALWELDSKIKLDLIK